MTISQLSNLLIPLYLVILLVQHRYICSDIAFHKLNTARLGGIVHPTGQLGHIDIDIEPLNNCFAPYIRRTRTVIYYFPIHYHQFYVPHLQSRVNVHELPPHFNRRA
jgi:hypothetical protein